MKFELVIALMLQFVEAMRKDQRVPLANSWINYFRHKVAWCIIEA